MRTRSASAILVDDTDVRHLLTKIQQVVSSANLQNFLTSRIDGLLHERMEARFDAQGDDVSGKWAPLRSATQTIRFFQGFNPTWPINVRYGDLRDWMMADGHSSVQPYGARIEYPGDMPSHGSELKQKLETAQKGRERPRTVPRPVLGMDEADLQGAVNLFWPWFYAEMATP